MPHFFPTRCSSDFEGFHPMTMYFPLVVHGAMLIEPTETESKAAMDQFIMALRSVAERAKEGDPALRTAPHFAPRRRLDETLAARKPVLVCRHAASSCCTLGSGFDLHQRPEFRIDRFAGPEDATTPRAHRPITAPPDLPLAQPPPPPPRP